MHTAERFFVIGRSLLLFTHTCPVTEFATVTVPALPFIIHARPNVFPAANSHSPSDSTRSCRISSSPVFRCRRIFVEVPVFSVAPYVSPAFPRSTVLFSCRSAGASSAPFSALSPSGISYSITSISRIDQIRSRIFHILARYMDTASASPYRKYLCLRFLRQRTRFR